MEPPLAIGVCGGLFSHSFNKQKHREQGVEMLVNRTNVV